MLFRSRGWCSASQFRAGSVGSWTNLIEPAMIIVMAVGVGGLLFSILQALFTITNNIAR